MQFMVFFLPWPIVSRRFNQRDFCDGETIKYCKKLKNNHVLAVSPLPVSGHSDS